MEESVISFETAVLAKEKGFDIPIKHWYDQIGCLNPVKGTRGSMVYENVGYAPTQALLQKWIRETHNLHIDIYRNRMGYQCNLERADSGTHIMKVTEGEKDTYEECLEKGLISALKEIIL